MKADWKEPQIAVHIRHVVSKYSVSESFLPLTFLDGVSCGPWTRSRRRAMSMLRIMNAVM